ncbi:MAG: HRDC domain-containing protein [Phaeodactylibacter sp.]|nr:HRDC domain-containing protein [Phaeodactylibacter sp.]MCB9303996.1 HRDC domain-containing protein [Lewinellaceae bacterium]HQU58225.1 HRDC domain-containing protein [Saprospiraceae bacterium]
MPNRDTEYTLIESPLALDEFYASHRNLSWIAFDTEFVGEKRYVTSLCLIQVLSEKGVFLIDPLRLKHIDPLLELIADPKITKITHAGDNDYRLLNANYGILPRNVFDTQIAAAFLGYKYPVSFRKLVEGELKKYLKKGYAVADWESRPLQKKHISYAIDDVTPLPGLWKSLTGKLEANNRLHWAQAEFAQLETAHFYEKDPHSEAINSNLMRSLNAKEQVFLLRLFEWRRQVAEGRNHSKEMVLPSKYISHIVRGIPSGPEALRHNRRIPDKIVDRFGKTFADLFSREISEEEQLLLGRIPSEEEEDPKEEIIVEMLYQVIKYKCLEQDISVNIVLPRNAIKKIRAKEDDALELLDDGWRKEFLGAYFLEWLASATELEMDLHPDRIILLPKVGQ